jgi:hypothetical protein
MNIQSTLQAFSFESLKKEKSFLIDYFGFKKKFKPHQVWVTKLNLVTDELLDQWCGDL